jgi:hypothetical protein
VHGSDRGFEFSIVNGRERLQLGEFRKWRRLLQVVAKLIVAGKVWKYKNRQVKPGFLGGESSFLQVSFPVIRLELGLDHIGVRDFSTLFELLAEAEEAAPFLRRELRILKFAFAGDYAIEITNHGGGQAPDRYLSSRSC